MNENNDIKNGKLIIDRGAKIKEYNEEVATFVRISNSVNIEVKMSLDEGQRVEKIRDLDKRTPFIAPPKEWASYGGNYTSAYGFPNKKLKKQKMMTEKKSVGIACCRRRAETSEIEILMVCRRCTYAFDLFMQGTYNTNNDGEILSLLNSMTFDEKLVLLSLDFKHVWYHWWMNNPVNPKFYHHLRDKYCNLITGGARRLKRLIGKSSSGAKIWEIPKGRKKRDENDLHAAIREFQEETSIEKRDYRLLRCPPQHMSYVDCNVKYMCRYFIALSLSAAGARVPFCDESAGEISEIKWMTLREIGDVDQFGRLSPLCRSIADEFRDKKH